MLVVTGAFFRDHLRLICTDIRNGEQFEMKRLCKSSNIVTTCDLESQHDTSGVGGRGADFKGPRFSSSFP